MLDLSSDDVEALVSLVFSARVTSSVPSRRRTVPSSLPPPRVVLPLTHIARRSYPLKKIQENNESEIMQVILQEARDSFAAELVVELTSESTDELEANVERIARWVEQWVAEHPEGV